ncbi:MAG TPA: Flp family type IVb pilin [Polyangia bacterium]|nr:Flp family type IVb pilin [Polyangia bacterium]
MSIRRAWKSLAADQSGATAVEYALILAAIAGLIMVVIFTFGGKVKGQYDTFEQKMP